MQMKSNSDKLKKERRLSSLYSHGARHGARKVTYYIVTFIFGTKVNHVLGLI